MSGTTSGGCYAVGDVLATPDRPGYLSGTGLLGRVVESPVVADYIAETHNVDRAGVPLAVLLGTDWWDAEGKKSYFDFLTKRHPTLDRGQLNRLNPVRPDILTHHGPTYVAGTLVSQRRSEFYEIKPDSPTGIRAGEEKLPHLRHFYRDHGLPYRPGVTYPRHPSKSKDIPLPLNREFLHLAQILLFRHGIKTLRMWVTVRRQQDALLVYKICVEIDTDDRRRQQTLAKAVAKHLYAAYVACHFPNLFTSVQKELGDHSFDGDKLPRIRCTFDVLDDLKPMQKAIEEALYMRGIALPGDELLLCCDEAYYWELLATRPYGTAYAWQKLLPVVKAWVHYAAGSVGWARVQPWIAKGEDVAGEIKERYPYHVGFADAVIEYARHHPTEFLLFVTLPIILTAGAALLIEAGLLASIVVADGVATQATATVIGGLGRTAMGELVATQTLGSEVASGAAVRGLISAQEVATQIGGLGASANEVTALGTVLSSSQLAATVKGAAVIGVAAAYVLGVNVKSAYAQTAPTGSPPAPIGSSPAPTSAAQLGPGSRPIGHAVSRLLAFPALAVPRNTLRRPGKGEIIDLYNHVPVAAPLVPRDPAERIQMRYLGRVRIS